MSGRGPSPPNPLVFTLLTVSQTQPSGAFGTTSGKQTAKLRSRALLAGREGRPSTDAGQLNVRSSRGGDGPAEAFKCHRLSKPSGGGARGRNACPLCRVHPETESNLEGAFTFRK